MRPTILSLGSGWPAAARTLRPTSASSTLISSAPASTRTVAMSSAGSRRDSIGLSYLSLTWLSRDARHSPLTSKYVRHPQSMPGLNVVEVGVHGMTRFVVEFESARPPTEISRLPL